MKILSLFFAVRVLIFPIHADETISPSDSEMKYTLSICAIFKNEANYLKEWIEYHKMVGVDHFYLFNNGSIDRSVEVLTPYVKEGSVTLIYWPNRLPLHLADNAGMWATCTQLPAYENASKYLAINETQWLVDLEIDEFIVPVGCGSIVEVLELYQESVGVELSSNFFCASRQNRLPKRSLVIETVELTDPPEENIENSVDKVIFKPKFHTTFTWPPYRCNFIEGKSATAMAKRELRINKYVNRSKGSPFFGKMKDKLHVDNRMLTDEEASMLLRVGYELEDQEKAIFRFVPELRKKMGLETGWNW